jgi:MFS family permease
VGILNERRFRRLFLARTAAVFGGASGPVALAFGVLALPGATATTLSLVVTANTAAMVVFMLFGGVVADRLPRYRVMVSADVIAGLSWLAVAGMLIVEVDRIWPYLVGSAVAGIGQAMFFPAMIGVVPEVVGSDQLQAANGVLRFGTNSARIAGFAFGGIAVAAVGAGNAMLLNGFLLLVSAGLLAGLRLPAVTRGESTRIWADLRDGWQEFRSRQWIWVVVLQFSFVVAALEAFYGVLGPYISKKAFDGAHTWSMVLTGEAVGMLLGVFIAIRIRPRRPILLGVGLTFALALAPLLLGIGAPLWSVVAGAFLGGLCIDIFGVLWETSMQREVPPAALSRVSSYDAMGSFMFGPLGAIAAGPLVTSIGVRAALVAAAATVAVPTALALLAKGVREVRVSPPQPGLAEADSTPATAR